MDINLRQLEAFIKVVDLGSFSLAGEALFLSQSTVSCQIAQLERSLNVALLRRKETRNVTLTEEGMRVYRVAVQIVEQAKGLESMFERDTGAQQTVAIAASTVPARYILPKILVAFGARYPQTPISVMSGDSAFALERLTTGEASLAFTGTKLRKTLFCYHTICQDRLVLITPNTPDFAQKQKDGVLGRTLLDHPVILRESGSGTRRETDRYLKSIGKSTDSLTVAAYMNDMEAIKQTVSIGGGVTMLSERAASDAIASGAVLCFALEQDGPYRDINLAYMKGRALTPAEQSFVDFVIKFGKE